MTREGAFGQTGLCIPLEGDGVGLAGNAFLDVLLLLHLEAEVLHGTEGLGLHVDGGYVGHVALRVGRHIQE